VLGVEQTPRASSPCRRGCPLILALTLARFFDPGRQTIQSTEKFSLSPGLFDNQARQLLSKICCLHAVEGSIAIPINAV
jgi:hypothetical protein